MLLVPEQTQGNQLFNDVIEDHPCASSSTPHVLTPPDNPSNALAEATAVGHTPKGRHTRKLPAPLQSVFLPSQRRRLILFPWCKFGRKGKVTFWCSVVWTAQIHNTLVHFCRSLLLKDPSSSVHTFSSLLHPRRACAILSCTPLRAPRPSHSHTRPSHHHAAALYRPPPTLCHWGPSRTRPPSPGFQFRWLRSPTADWHHPSPANRS